MKIYPSVNIYLFIYFSKISFIITFIHKKCLMNYYKTITRNYLITFFSMLKFRPCKKNCTKFYHCN